MSDQLQIDFVAKAQKPLRFNGPEYDSDRDNKRLSSQFWTLLQLMSDGKWRTLQHIQQLTRYPESSISAQLRHMRKPRFGKHTVERQHIERGLYEYRVLINEDWRKYVL